MVRATCSRQWRRKHAWQKAALWRRISTTAGWRQARHFIGPLRRSPGVPRRWSPRPGRVSPVTSVPSTMTSTDSRLSSSRSSRACTPSGPDTSSSRRGLRKTHLHRSIVAPAVDSRPAGPLPARTLRSRCRGRSGWRPRARAGQRTPSPVAGARPGRPGGRAGPAPRRPPRPGCHRAGRGRSPGACQTAPPCSTSRLTAGGSPPRSTCAGRACGRAGTPATTSATAPPTAAYVTTGLVRSTVWSTSPWISCSLAWMSPSSHPAARAAAADRHQLHARHA